MMPKEEMIVWLQMNGAVLIGIIVFIGYAYKKIKQVMIMNTQVIKRWQDIPQICEDDINYLSGDRGELPSVMILKDMNVFDDDEIIC